MCVARREYQCSLNSISKKDSVPHNILLLRCLYVAFPVMMQNEMNDSYVCLRR